MLLSRCLVVAVLSLGGASWAEDAGAPPALAGTWLLDAERTSDPKPVLEHFQANFFVKRFARSVTPTNVITWNGDRFGLEVRAVTVTKRTTIVLDGKTPTADDIFGNPYEYTSLLVDGAVVSKGTVRRADGKQDELAMRRSVEPDGRMVLRMTITPPGEKPLEISRVFNRVPSGGAR